MVEIVNRYFVPLHLDNRDGSGVRYGFEPGHENAYILFETPELTGGPKVDTVIHGTLRETLEPANAIAEARAFLAKHPEYHHPDPTLSTLSRAEDPDSRVKYAERLLEEGDADKAQAALAGSTLPRAALLRARALRLKQQWSDAAAALSAVPSSVPAAETEMERIRLANESGDAERAAILLDRFLGVFAADDSNGEAHFLRGWLYHRAGMDDRAAAIWTASTDRFPPATALFSQKAHLTQIRMNWDLPANVDQASGEDHDDSPPQ
jgi:tetratricopeptide (TPR) repeat protein